ncbi:MAG: hypothetical protein ABIL58_18095 [Pseudomonadota bacterium]
MEQKPLASARSDTPKQHRRRKKPIFLMAGIIVCMVIGAVSLSFAQSLPDLSGRWSGDWGEVVLERIGPVSYAGTYSSTHGKDVGRMTFSHVAGNYEGKWWEGTFRMGVITLQVSDDGRVLTGLWSASPASTINPGQPIQSSCRWTKK